MTAREPVPVLGAAGAVRASAALVLPGQPGDEDGPVFAEAWHAELFALTLSLVEAGAFSWRQWTEALSAAVAAAQADGDADLGDTYYDHWLAALEALGAQTGLVAPHAIDARAEEWRLAYLATPHGEPVLLSRLTSPVPHGPHEPHEPG